MQCFQENYCRLCPKSFCCKNCRFTHEEKIHKVNPDCEICIYGRTTIKKLSVSLLSHIKNQHWPLHCAFCKKIFSSLDELVPHEKCVLRLDAIKMQGTPKTPLTEKDEQSPEITPFYKCINVKNGIQITQTALAVTAVTSTPLFNKEDNKNEKITPNNYIEISAVHKSNLKLTGSSNLSDSKKSERRVTFSDTPSLVEPVKKPKFLPLTPLLKHIEKIREEASNSDDSYNSADEEFKTAPFTLNEEKENFNEVTFERNSTLWESALTKLDVSSCDNNTNLLNVSVQINVINSLKKSDESSENFNLIKNDVEESSLLNKSTNLWSSMTNIVKSVVNNISMTAQNSFTTGGLKRSQPDTEGTELPTIKRIKLTDIKCRRPIREISPLYGIRFKTKPRCVDKATQTDESWL